MNIAELRTKVAEKGGEDAVKQFNEELLAAVDGLKAKTGPLKTFGTGWVDALAAAENPAVAERAAMLTLNQIAVDNPDLGTGASASAAGDTDADDEE